MEKSASKSLCIFPVVAWLLLTTIVLISATSIQSVNGSISWEWGDSTVGSTVVAGDQEFLMDSQFGNVLADPPGRRPIVYRASGTTKPICNLLRYANCIPGGRPGRPCRLIDRCPRKSPQWSPSSINQHELPIVYVVIFYHPFDLFPVFV